MFVFQHICGKSLSFIIIIIIIIINHHHLQVHVPAHQLQLLMHSLILSLRVRDLPNVFKSILNLPQLIYDNSVMEKNSDIRVVFEDFTPLQMQL